MTDTYSPRSAASGESFFGFKSKKTTVPDSVSVYNSDLFEDLVATIRHSEPPRSPKSPQRDGNGFGFFGTSDSVDVALRGERKREAREKRLHQTRKLQTMRAEYEKSVSEEDRRSKQMLAERRRREEERFQKSLEEIEEAQESFREINEYLERMELNEQRKKEALHKEWVKCVYEPIQDQIQKKLSQMSTAEIEERRFEMYDKYINATNRNQGIFRDIINPNEYDPLKGK